MKKWMSIFIVIAVLMVGCSSKEDVKTSEAPLNQSEDNVTIVNDEESGTTDTAETSSDGEVHDNANNETSNKDQGSKKTPPRNDDGKVTTKSSIVAGSMESSIQYVENKDELEFNFKVKNQTENMFTYHFKDAQRYYYVIMDDKGKVVKKYSQSKKDETAKLPGSEPLKPGGELNYKVTVPKLQKGTYTINFVLTSEETPPKASFKFTIK
jgi:hypothetical protein